MGRYPDGPTSCSKDPSCKVRIHSLGDLGPLLVLTFWGFVLVVCSTFQLFKLRRLMKMPFEPLIIKEGLKPGGPVALNNASQATNGCLDQKNHERKYGEDVLVNMGNEKELQITGYTNSIFGEFCYFLCCLVSVHWIALFLLILIDLYNKCEIGSIDNLCFYGNYFIFGTFEFNARVFFVVWWLAAIWFTAWVMNRGKVHHWFRLPCDLPSANVIYLWTQDHKEILSINVFFFVSIIRRIKNRFTSLDAKGYHEIITIEQTKSGKRFFLFQGRRYLIKGDSVHGSYFKVGDSFSDLFQCEQGLAVEEAEKRLELVGPNEIPFKPERFLYTLYAELFTLFRVYQLVTYILWFWFSYLFVGALLSFVVMLSASITIFIRRRSQHTIAKITDYVTDVEVLRGGSWLKLESRNIVPGDVVKVRSSWLLPCDLFIIQGSCICDESALTGEAMPVPKYSAPNTSTVYLPEGHGARHTLFSGTLVLQAGTLHNDDVRAVVTATGMDTSKGELLSAILYPENMIFKYDEELPAVVLFLILYAITCFIISLIFQNHTGAQTLWMTKWNYCMAVLNQIISPLLPVALEVGHLHAVKRLKKCGIFCLNPKRIAVSGKIRLFLFDKTGTLTKEGLDFFGVQSLSNVTEAGPSFGPLLSLNEVDSVGSLTLHGLATCHAVSRFGDQYVGSQVEVKMFEAVRWELSENTNGLDTVHNGIDDELRIVKRHEFDHTRATMTVIVQDTKGFCHIYCKGSFEKIQQLSSPKSLPKDYLERAWMHAFNGCYVLALGHRSLGSEVAIGELQGIPRNELEKDLQFVALILFRNELKVDSYSAIKALKEGEIRPVMVTGDNAQCGQFIARACGMVAPQAQIILGDIDCNNSIFWQPMTTDSDANMNSLSTEELLQLEEKGLDSGLVELAMTGKAFNVLRSTKFIDKLIFYTRIFARFTPADKVLVTKLLRNHGLIVGMCGDGGNDCGALRAAHVGIALSEAEASIVSPFTSKDKSVTSVVHLLREGRGALHSSFASYKFIIMYGLMFSIFKLCCYWYGVITCQMNYIFIDGVAVLTLGYAMTLSYPEDKLGKERPTSSLFGAINMTSVCGVWVINLVFLIGAVCFMKEQPDYVRWPAEYSHGANWWTLGDNWESTVLFFTMYFQFINSSFIFTFGSSFRKNVFYNWLLMAFYGGLLIFMSSLLLLPPNGFTSIWHVASEQFNKQIPSSPVWETYQKNGGLPSPGMPFEFRFRLWLLIVGGLATAITWQKVIVEGPVSRSLAEKFPSKRPKFRI